MQVADGPRFSFTTPGHQDYYFFRPVQFCTAWIALMDIDESIDGWPGQNSNQEGLLWWQGKEYLVWRSPAQASESVVARHLKTGNADRVWLRSDYRMGDVLIFHPLTMHAGIPNASDQVRLSADFRCQRQGTQTHWESQTDMVESSQYFGAVVKCLDELRVETGGVYERVWETMRLDRSAAGRLDRYRFRFAFASSNENVGACQVPARQRKGRNE